MIGLLISDVNENRINIIFYANLIISLFGIVHVIQKRKQWLFILGAVYAIYAAIFFHYYFNGYAEVIAKRFYGGFMDALTEAGQYDCDRYYITPDTQFEGSRRVSEILTMFAH